VSIIIPAYNQSKYLGSAIESALSQTYRKLEVIVVDDGSTDETPEVVGRFSDPRIRYEWQRNHGLSAARNTGIRIARGGYYAFLDSDDEFLPNKLEVLLDAMSGRAEIGLTAGKAIPIDVHGQVLSQVFDLGIPGNLKELVLKNPLHVGSVLVRRSWIVKVGLFDETLRSYEDWDMWLRLARAGCQMQWVDEPVSLYRFHDAQMTRDGVQMTDANFKVLDKFFKDMAPENPWLEMHDEAYAQAHLRAAANAYFGKDFEKAKQHLVKAVSFSKDLLDVESQKLPNTFRAWTDSPKVRDPLGFLEDVYANLPELLMGLREWAPTTLVRTALNIAFEAHSQGDRKKAGRAVRYAVRRKPGLLTNRGVLSIFTKSLLAI
jgi:glycosyltransferase involved in cell wall biosynthesis